MRAAQKTARVINHTSNTLHFHCTLHKGLLSFFMRRLKKGLNQDVICRFDYLRNINGNKIQLCVSLFDVKQDFYIMQDNLSGKFI